MNTSYLKDHRPLRQIAMEIMRNWKSPFYGALPYISAMRQVNKITDNYGADSAEEIVLRFLLNASSWRGSEARNLKKELNNMLRDLKKARGED